MGEGTPSAPFYGTTNADSFSRAGLSRIGVIQGFAGSRVTCGRLSTDIFPALWILLCDDGNPLQGEWTKLSAVALGGSAMAINRLFQQDAFAPEAVRDMVEAYKKALGALDLAQRYDGIAEVLARKIVEAAQRGVTGADRLCELTLEELGSKRKAKPGHAQAPARSPRSSVTPLWRARPDCDGQ